jgi:uncharacterized membrane protein YphA (DoxX/SURF4 family)
MTRSGLVRTAARLVVGGLFIWAGVLKIADPLAFARDISNFRLVPAWAALLAALVLPWIEVLCGAAVILGPLRRTGALLIAAMLAGFILLTVVTMARGIDTNCGCFGALSHKADWTLLVQDAVLLGLALLASGESARPRPDPGVASTHCTKKCN